MKNALQVAFGVLLVAAPAAGRLSSAAEVPRGPIVAVVTADGERLRGVLTDFNTEKDGLRLLVGGKTRSLAADSPARIEFPAAAHGRRNRSGLRVFAEPGGRLRFVGTPEPPNRPDYVYVVLRDGGVLRGTVTKGNDKALTVVSEVLGKTASANKAVFAVLFSKAAQVTVDERRSLLEGAPPEGDVLLTAKGERVEGFLDSLSDQAVVMETGGQKRTFPFTDTAAVRYAALEATAPATGLHVAVELTDGCRLVGRPVGLKDGCLRLKGSGKTVWKLPVEKIVALRVRGGRTVFLSELKPAAIEERPLPAGMPVVYPLRRDLSAAGTPLRIGPRGKPYERGLGVHAYSALTYELAGKYELFVCEVGMDAAAAEGAACSYKVFGDDPAKPRAVGTVKAGDKPRRLKLDVRGVNRLRLVCDFGPDGDDAGDFFDWADAGLIKKKD